ncbi:acyltransferase family protein [Mangrovibacterium diazotrophicum]|uniref:Ankyrin repeat protein n=1 Tax=Mangrovibacterium diazotrophicum TaxID=1261403 RepID=A0A419W8U0_9BACT|nr:acyltransferase family protein [Mangrovibacterium diazotrophicum]RKD91875.1 ankyrin repeat protein [Mangrovibacterium diazotrophicum]
MKTRVYFLDNLRTFLIFLVVLLHSGLVYEFVLANSWIVVDPEKSNWIGIIRMYLDLFVMFSIFFISGYFVRISVQGKEACRFVRSKLRRITLPWAVAVLTLIPAYKFIFLYSRGLPQENWMTYFHFFERTGSDLTFFANNPTQNWLWFLPVLFAFQLLYLALYKMNLLSFRIGLKTGILLAFGVSFAYSSAISFFNLSGWTHSFLFDFQNERLGVYMSAFLLGSLVNKLNVFDNWQKNVRQYIWGNVLLTVVLCIFTAVALNLFFNLITPGRDFYFVSELVDRLVYQFTAILSMFSFLYVLLYAFRFQLNRTNNLLAQLAASSYSVYIIHTVVLGIFALILLKSGLPSSLKFIVLTISTYATSTYLVYAWRMGMQKQTMLKTTPAFVLVGLMMLLAFSGKPVAASAEERSAIVEQPMSVQSIHAAVIGGDLQSVKQLLDQGEDIDKADPEGGSSPLILAAMFGQTEIAGYLIERGANLNFQNNDGSTPLHTAAFFCRTAIVSDLLEHGADTGVRNKSGSNALESMQVPFEVVKGIYEYFAKVYGPLGLNLDLERIESVRPEIAAQIAVVISAAGR